MPINTDEKWLKYERKSFCSPFSHSKFIGKSQSLAQSLPDGRAESQDIDWPKKMAKTAKNVEIRIVVDILPRTVKISTMPLKSDFSVERWGKKRSNQASSLKFNFFCHIIKFVPLQFALSPFSTYFSSRHFW